MPTAPGVTSSSVDRTQRLPAWAKYGGALAAVFLATWASLKLTTPFYSPEWFLAPAALIVVTWYLGKGPGWTALLASVLAAQYFFIPPLNSFRVGWRDVPFFASFVVCEVLAGWAVNARMATERRLREANDVLSAKDRAEQDLRNANLEVARLMRVAAMAEMAAAIAHEVNQPLAAIVANADACEAWLTSIPPNFEEARSAAERAVKGATRATEVIGRIRGMMTKSEINRKRVDLNELIRSAIELTSYRYASTRVVFDTQLTRLPEALVDDVQVQQVILNLLSNAVNATADLERKPCIRISSSVEAGEFKVTVSDNGRGALATEIENLFKPFYTTRKTGIGVGLSISRSIVEAHGGRLWAEPNRDHGLTFHLSLPIQDHLT